MSGAASTAVPRTGPGRTGMGAHQESDVHRAGSTLLGVTVKVLFRMLITGRALGRDGGQLSFPPPAAAQSLFA